MYTRENVRHALFRQSVYGTDPGSPAGTLVPREASSVVEALRKPLDNPQVQADGFEREPALGNFTSLYKLKAVCNFEFLGWVLNCLCGGSTIVGNGVASIPTGTGGTGYTGGATVAIGAPPAGGVQATATATVAGGIITGYVITNPGEGYTSAPTVTVTPVSGGSGAAPGTPVLGAPYRRKFLLTSTVLLTLLEEGIPLANLYYKYYDFVPQKTSFKCGVEGILTVDTEWPGTGKGGDLAPATSPLDANPVELVGTPGEYANITTLEAAVDSGDIADISIDIMRKVVEKRVQGKGGIASELRFGGSTVRGQLTKYFETDALATKARVETITSLQTTINGLAGTNYFAQMLMPEVKVFPVGRKIDGDNGVMQVFDFRSIRKSNTTTSPIQFLLANGTVTYP